MPSDQLVDARLILEALAEVNRRGVWPLLQDLERAEPELANFIFEEGSLLHSRLFKTGAKPKQIKILQRQVQKMIVVSITALSLAYRRLWEQQSESPPVAGRDVSFPQEHLKKTHPTPVDGIDAVPGNGVSMAQTIEVRVNRRELATILAALRFHQDENLQDRGQIADQVIGGIATDDGKLMPLDFDEVERVCQRLNIDSPAKEGLHIELPPRDGGEEPLFRVVYVIDVNAADARRAAEHVHQLMSDPGSMAPVLHVLDPAANLTRIDLAGGGDLTPGG